MTKTNIVEVPKRSLIADMAEEYGMDPVTFQATLKATVVPANTSNEDFAAFLLVAKHYKLNPILKEIFAFPKRGGGIQPIVSVDGWANLVNSHPACDGFEFYDVLDDKNALVSVTCKMYRKDRAHPIEATEYMVECARATDTWKQWPRRMLRHKAMIQAARYAFGFAGIIDQDEAERIVPSEPVKMIEPPPAPKAEAMPKPAPEVAQELSTSSGDLREYLDQLAVCTSPKAVEDLRDAGLSSIFPGDIQEWKDKCASKAEELF